MPKPDPTTQLDPPRAEPEPLGQTELINLLHERGQRVTPQRLVIMRELRRRGRHATADEIRRAVRDDLPGTSAPTVYATLELLVELGLVRRIDTSIGAALYDARTEPHQHLVCRRCGSVADLDGKLDATDLLGSATAAGFRADDVQLVISGRCGCCAAGRDSPPRDVTREPAQSRLRSAPSSDSVRSTARA